MSVKRTLYLYTVLCAILLSTGCASIAGSPMHSVKISSGQQSYNFSVVDEEGEEVAKGTTPDTVVLRTSSAPFRAARYIVNFDSDGQAMQSKELNARFSPWYFLNIFAGYTGVIGILVIDPFTGALYRLPNDLLSHTSSSIQ